MAACARAAPSGDGPTPASGFDMRMAAMPHVAMPQDGSRTSTSRNDFSASLYQKECSMATERWKLACTAGLQELAKSTLPSWSLDWLSEERGKASSNTVRTRFAFMWPRVWARCVVPSGLASPGVCLEISGDTRRFCVYCEWGTTSAAASSSSRAGAWMQHVNRPADIQAFPEPARASRPRVDVKTLHFV